MNIIIERFKKIQSNISKIGNSNGLKIIAISKTFSLDQIMPLIEFGHNHFGENKVQEAEDKWSEAKTIIGKWNEDKIIKKQKECIKWWKDYKYQLKKIISTKIINE